MAIQLVYADYARSGAGPGQRGAPAGSFNRAAPRRSIHWGMVLLTGSVAWLLVGGVVVATCLWFRPYVAKGSALLAVSVAAPVPVTPVAPKPEPQPARPEPPAKAVAPPAPAAATDKAIEKKPAAPTVPARAPAAPALPASERLVADGPPDFKNYGTQVDFVDSPAEAARLATRARKLCFIIHLSGNFEDAKFT